jgi:hypothetical protein
MPVWYADAASSIGPGRVRRRGPPVSQRTVTYANLTVGDDGLAHPPQPSPALINHFQIAAVEADELRQAVAEPLDPGDRGSLAKAVNLVANTFGLETVSALVPENLVGVVNRWLINHVQPADFDVSITDQVAHTASHTWSQSNSVEFTQTFKYEIGFLGTGGGGETSMSYNHTWGESKTESKTVTVGSTSGIVVRLEPGQSVIARLAATRGFLDVRVTYRATLSGVTAVNYNPKYDGHYFWALPINSVMNSGGLSTSRTITEEIRVGYYSNDEIELVDPTSNRVLASYRPQAIAGDDANQPAVLELPSAALV